MKTRMVLLGCLFLIGETFGLDTIRVQKFTITDVIGVVEVWSSQKSRWLPFDNKTELPAGSTIAAREASSFQITLEPAIIMSVKPNSIIKLSNLQVHETKKMIRTMINLQIGDIALKTSGLKSTTLFLTVTTPTAGITINNAEIELHAGKDSTVVVVRNGEAKAENNSSAIKSTIPGNHKAIITSVKPDVEISSLEAVSIKASGSTKQSSIAILSIQAQGVNKENVAHVANYVAEQYQEASEGSKVLFLDDIREMLRVEQSERLLDCFTDSCISRIGSVLGVDLVIIGNLGQLGNNYMFSLKLIDVLRDKTLKRVTKTVESDVGLILNEIPTMVGNLAKVEKILISEAFASKPKITEQQADIRYNERESWISGGSFIMGVDFDGKTFDAVPQHTVNVKGFYMDKYEVSREEFQKVMGFNPSTFRGCETCPVENVTWTEAESFCKKQGKRLPTEAEWEYACRAGTTTKFSYGDVLSGEQANFDSRYPFGGVPASTPRSRPIPGGEFKPNVLGLFDMHGNVAEWCSDWYDAAYYGNSPVDDPKGPSDGKLKVVRGGAWNGVATTLFSGKRFAYNKEIRLPSIGFRCARDDYSK